MDRMNLQDLEEMAREMSVAALHVSLRDALLGQAGAKAMGCTGARDEVRAKVYMRELAKRRAL